MKLRRRFRILLGAFATAAITFAAGNALAYFTTSGAGEASAAVTSFSKSTITSATPAPGGTVTLNWSVVTPPGAGTVTYYVTRDGGVPGGTCPPSTAAAAVTTCVDKGLSIGSHTYIVVALWHTWSSSSAPATANVTVGEATHLAITASPTSITAAGSTNLTISAKDANESTVTTYTGTKNLTFSGAGASPSGTAPTVANSSGTAVAFGTATALTFTSGVATVSSTKNGVMKLYRAETAQVSATDGTISTTTPVAVTVSPAALSKFTLGAESTSPAAGAADDLTITAQDAYSNTVTSFTGSHNLVFSGASAAPNGTLPTVSDSAGNAVAFGTATPISFSSGVATATGVLNGEMRIYKSGAAAVKVTEGAITSATVTITVAPGSATKLSLTASSLTPAAGASDNLTITAQDVYSNTATTYTGTKNLTFSGAGASPSGTAPTVSDSSGTAVAFGTATALTFTSGVATVSSAKNGVMKLAKAEAASISATDGTITTSAGLAVTVSAGTASRIAFTNAAASAGSLSSPCLFTCTATGLGNSGTLSANIAITDSFGNTVNNLGTGHSVRVTASGGTVADATLTMPSTGAAESATRFTYTAPASGAFTNTITAATSAGTVYTSATITASK
jgi:uncharacterized membrane protein